MKFMDTMEEEIVISGISGRFPESSNMKEFSENLLNNINLVTVNERRFRPGIYGIPEGFGTLKEIDKLDAEFFHVPPNQASRMDPQLRMTLETTYEAMLDAGVNPTNERESRTGVFFGVCASDANVLWNAQPSKIEGATMTGCAHSMFANRISYTFDFNGPSCCYDTACSTSIVALEAAVASMRAGKCDAAIVTASTLILSPHTSVQFNKLGMLAPDSACKSFDSSGNGYVRSEAVATIYLQKKSLAKRVYATVVHVKTNTDGFKDGGITFPSANLQKELLRETYEEAGIDKDQVVYIESHGTGTAVGDPQEFLSIAHTFTNLNSKRTDPLYLGSVKSNMGHSEGASGLCGIAKVVIALQEGIIPANLNYKNPHYNMKALRDRKIQIVDQNIPLRSGLIALNSFGFGGVNTHVILKPYGNQRKRFNGITDRNFRNSIHEIIPEVSLPRLINISGRTDEAVRFVLVSAENINDLNLHNLLNDGHKSNIPGHTFRGFSIPGHSVAHVEEMQPSSGIWFVFNGIGSQWAGMGQDLMKIPVVAKSIQTSAKTLLAEFNYDLMSALNNTELRDDPTTCFVTIAAIQIAIVDVLSFLGVHPRGFIGHSAGEMLCAYIDGCLSSQETIICAYLRGNSLEVTKNTNESIKYGMAVIGDTWEHVSETCLEGIYPACHNGSDSVTVSGPTELLETYITRVKGEKRIAKAVNSCGIAFHSPYVENASGTFLNSLQNLIKSPQVRSKRWISSSIPKKDWSTEFAQTASPEYFNNNFKSPVLFYDALKEIPENATIIEIGPSGLLKGLIKKGTPTCTVIPVQSRDSKNGLVDFVKALGHLYIAHVNEFDVNKLYGEPEYPVPLGTPMISPFIKWDHGTSWDVPIYGKNGEFLEGVFEVDLTKESDRYLSGHQIQGRVLFPATGYIVLVWKCFAQMHQMNYEKFPVIFENIKFSRVTVLRGTGKVEFRVNISDVSGNFEIKEGGAAIVSGRVRSPIESDVDIIPEYKLSIIQSESSQEFIQKENVFVREEIYKQFRFSGYEYAGLFKGIKKRDSKGKYFYLDWSNNWVAFLDTFMQTTLGIFRGNYTHTELPTDIQKLSISPQHFLEYIAINEPNIKDTGVFILFDNDTELIRCNGIELSCLEATPISGSGKREPDAIFSPHKFCKFFNADDVAENKKDKTDEYVCPITQFVTIIMENIESSQVNTIPDIAEICGTLADSDSLKISKLIRQDFSTPDINYSLYSEKDQPTPELIAKYSQANISLLAVETMQMQEMMDLKFDIAIVHNNLYLSLIYEQIHKGGFILCKFPLGKVSQKNIIEEFGKKCTLIASRRTETHDMYLGRKNMKNYLSDIKVVEVSTNDLSWVTNLRDIMIYQEQLTLEKNVLPLIYLVSNGEDEDSGILGLTLCLRKEPFSRQIRSIFSRTKISLNFDEPDDLLKDILKRDLATTIINSDGSMGCYIHSPISNQVLVPSKNIFLGMEKIGDLSTLCWIQGIPYETFPSIDGYIHVKVHVSALNFKDIMLSSGNLHPEKKDLPFTMESPLGFEFSGETGDGDKVFGFCEGQSLATNVLANLDWVWKIPKGWSYEDAATVPVVYSTVYLALVMRGQIQEGESILIHAGAGGVGLAAIRVALSMKCQIFTTVGSKEKISYLRKTFPQIPESHIGFSRDTSFEQMVLELTHGCGVDLVLNSLSGDKLEASVRCLARHGRFLEIGKVDLVSNKALGMRLFVKDASYHGVMLDSLWDSRPSARLELKQLIQNGINHGVIQPLPHRVFNHEQVEPAFRYLGQGRHIGKVLVSFDSQAPNSIPARPHVYFHPSKSYIIPGGLGGVGLEFVNWMTTRYAKKLVLTSRKGIVSAYQAEYVRKWRSQGIAVKLLTLDGSDAENAIKLLHEAEELGPLGGFFNLTMVLQMGLMKCQSEESFKFVMGPKVNMTKHFDVLTRKKCPQLDHFVVFSSVAAGLGFDGVSNYGLANSAAERIIEQRCRDGLPGKAIQWGPIGEVGAWHDQYNADFKQNNYRGSGVQSIASVLKSFDITLRHSCPVILSRRLMDAGIGTAGGSINFGVIDRISHILGHGSSRKLNPNAKLTEFGMDSVMSMEVRQILEQDYNLCLTAVEIRSRTLSQLEEMASNNPKNKMAVTNTTNQAATAGLFQLNFIKNMTRSRFIFEQCVFPINDLAKKRLQEGTSVLNSKGSIFVINSVEGPEVLALLGSLLHLPAYSMQMTIDAPLDTIKELTQHYYDKLKATEPVGPYIIVGYSAGVYVGIELTLRLQELGEMDKLYFLDMTPGRFEAILNENLGTKDRDSIDETDLAIVMMTQVFGLDRNDVEKVLRKEQSVEGRTKKIQDILSKVFEEKIDLDKMQDMMSTKGRKYFALFDNYKINGEINGKIILIKTTQNLISYDSDEFWGLEMFCKQTPIVHIMDTTHSYLITEPTVRLVANSINND